MENINAWFRSYPFNFRLSAHMGVYRIDDPETDVSIMCDRALLALKSVKGSFTTRIAWYDESLRSTILEEQELSDEMVSALEDRQFVLYFQPQIDYASGSMVGAEVLVRWQHPTKGLISPAKFIPLFERNGFISTLDEYVWEESCRYMRKWLDQKGKLLPVSVSVNISRVDIYNPQLCSHLESLVRRYDLPASYLRLEITESAYMQNPEQLISVVKKLRETGFTVEMDDFGSGYSSLNTLKDVPVNALKLDIRFLSRGEDDARGGSILSSVIRMAHWLDMPVIAEGVENKTQADYLKSLNCFYMQGYYFGKPMPAGQFEALLDRKSIGSTNRFGTNNLKGVAAFWDPSAQTALLFNSLVDGAAILEYREGNAEILRANDKFYTQIGATREEYLEKQKHTLRRFDEANGRIYLGMLESAIRTGDEAECEVRSLPMRAGEAPIWTHNRVRLLANNADGYLFYLAVENVTERKKMEEQLRVSREELQLAISQIGRAVCTYDIASRTLTVPESYARKHRIPVRIPDVPDNPCLPPLLPRDYKEYCAFYRDIAAGKENCRATVRVAEDGGGFRWERFEAAPVCDEAGKPVRAVISVEDVTAQIDREADDERNRLLLEREKTGLFDYDIQNRLLVYQVNVPGKKLEKRTIGSFTDVLRKSSRIPRESAEILLHTIADATQTAGQGALEFRADLWDQGLGWCRMRYVTLADLSGRAYRCLGQVEDINGEREKEALDKKISRYLGVTTLPGCSGAFPERVLDQLYAARDIGAAVDRVLQAVVSYCHVSRAYIFENSSDRLTCSNTFEQCAEGVGPRKKELQDCPYPFVDGKNLYFENFDGRGIFFCPNISLLPPDERKIPEMQGFRSVLQCLILDEGRFCGFLGVGDCDSNRIWTQEQISTLTAVFRIVGTFLLRWRGSEAPGENR